MKTVSKSSFCNSALVSDWSVKIIALLAVLVVNGPLSNPVYAVTTYGFSGTCFEDCVAHGVLGTDVDTVTGFLELSITITDTWDAADVLAYSFTYGDFTIDDGNSTVVNSVTGNIPFTSTPFAPFTAGDGFLVAFYDPDPNVFLNITLGGLNLVQPNEPVCGAGSCQAIALGTWSVIPVPPAVWLFASGLMGMVLFARRQNA